MLERDGHNLTLKIAKEGKKRTNSKKEIKIVLKAMGDVYWECGKDSGNKPYSPLPIQKLARELKNKIKPGEEVVINLWDPKQNFTQTLTKKELKEVFPECLIRSVSKNTYEVSIYKKVIVDRFIVTGVKHD